MEKGLNVQDFPQIEEDWAIVAESFLSFGGRRDGGGFDNRLVVDRSVGPLGRSPGEGDDEAVDRDARTLRDRYERWFQPILDGVRSRTEA